MKKHPVVRFCRRFLSYPGIRAVTPDSWYLRALYRVALDRKLNLRNPRTFNEKLQWLKLRVRDPFFTKLVDKYEVRSYIASKIGAEYLVPLVGGPWDRFEQVDFDALPNQFVLKCTHDSGGLVICRDKNAFNVDAARRKLERALRRNCYWPSREPPYRDVPPRLIAERYLEDLSPGGLRDYKLYVFNGKTRLVNVCSQRFTGNGLRVTFYDESWNLLPFNRKYPRETVAEPKPEAFERLVELAETLVADLVFARVDFYLNKGSIYVGEITFYPGGGLEGFDPEEWDATIGGWLDLSRARTTRSSLKDER